ncbi:MULTISPECIES: hypothetical protein [unclassified Kitasatospora]|uniref:hypothetical protein n=1 Tax=unclassified Kitasatospora TaxID=2633591 RepID=UPI001ADF1427|nr:hypothetical protein [Kitasatospora sp. RG8]MBP0455412.1 hypothetical protein [Kitasatospora sp. RG8]
MPPRHLEDERPPTAGPVTHRTPDTLRDPVLIGDIIFDTLAEIARRRVTAPPPFPAQRTRPHP